MDRPRWLTLLVLALAIMVVALAAYAIAATVAQRRASDPASILIGTWERRVEAAPDDIEAQRALAAAYQQAGEFGKARELYESVVAASPQDVAARYNLGVCK